MEGETIMICIDTWMKSTESRRFKDQSHPETVVGKSGMGKELGIHLPKRITVFAGGPVYDSMDRVQILGKALKERNIACDAICFGDPADNKQELFDTVIALADNNGNCNILHVAPESSVCDALSSSQIIRSGSAPFASILVQQESSKLNTKAAATYPETANPHDHPAKINVFSQSVVDLKLEDVKPNSQPETLDLDQRIERARRELESLIMQKKNKFPAEFFVLDG